MPIPGYLRPVRPVVLCALILTVCALGSAGHAATAFDWWPDPDPTTGKTGLAVWVNEDYQDAEFVNQLVDAIHLQAVDVVFVKISSANLPRLSQDTDPFTVAIQNLLNRLATPEIGIRACASILSDFFRGTDADMARVALVDHVIAFNSHRGLADAGFTCVGTDLEMQRACPPRPCANPPEPGFRNSTVYDKWKEFHRAVKDRLASQGSDLKLVAWMDGPDVLVQTMDDPADRAALMAREGITLISTSPTLYSGAIQYFATLCDPQPCPDGVRVAIADAVIPMWYQPTPSRIQSRLDHNVAELQGLPGDTGVNKPFLIAAMKVPQADLVCRDRAGIPVNDCITTMADFQAVLSHNNVVRCNASSFLGTAVFKWPIPEGWGTSLGECPTPP